MRPEGGEAPRVGRIARVLEPGRVGDVVPAALAHERLVSKARALLCVHEQVVRDVDRPAISGLVACRRAADDGDGRYPLVATEHVVHRALQRPELCVVDLHEDRAVVAHEIAGGPKALDHHRAPRRGLERVVVLDEPAPRVERRVEIHAAKPPGEPGTCEALHRVEVLAVDERVAREGVAVRAPRVALEAGRRRREAVGLCPTGS